jgi:hypothetical protein
MESGGQGHRHGILSAHPGLKEEKHLYKSVTRSSSEAEFESRLRNSENFRSMRTQEC